MTVKEVKGTYEINTKPSPGPELAPNLEWDCLDLFLSKCVRYDDQLHFFNQIKHI